MWYRMRVLLSDTKGLVGGGYACEGPGWLLWLPRMMFETRNSSMTPEEPLPHGKITGTVFAAIPLQPQLMTP
jgi:hypothetical protein